MLWQAEGSMLGIQFENMSQLYVLPTNWLDNATKLSNGSHYSDSNCIRGVLDIPVSEVGSRTRDSGITTLLIPEMNFTCNATIVGFIVAGSDLNSGPHSQVQIWRKNNSAVYYQVGNFSVDTAGGNTVCMAERAIVGNTRWCTLRNNLLVSVQPGDIFGLELPSTNDDEIFFTSGGPVNYVFGCRLNSNANLSNNGSYTIAQQLPQIVLNLTSGKACAGNFCGLSVHYNSNSKASGNVTCN